MSQLKHKSERVRVLTGHGTPRTELKVKQFKLTVQCAATFTNRIAEHENMVNDLLVKKLYSRMKPTNIYQGTFEVTEGFEDAFRKIAREHGFNATEVMEC